MVTDSFTLTTVTFTLTKMETVIVALGSGAKWRPLLIGASENGDRYSSENEDRCSLDPAKMRNAIRLFAGRSLGITW
jgi:hypothetical protein